MIGRLWHGWTQAKNADAYEALLKAEILPGIHRIEGYRGSYLLRRDARAKAEFITLTLWDSANAINAFAGPDGDAAVVPPEARLLLARFDARSLHYDAIWCP